MKTLTAAIAVVTGLTFDAPAMAQTTSQAGPPLLRFHGLTGSVLAADWRGSGHGDVPPAVACPNTGIEPTCLEYRWKRLPARQKAAAVTICSWDPRLPGTENPPTLSDAYHAWTIWRSISPSARVQFQAVCDWMKTSHAALR